MVAMGTLMRLVSGYAWSWAVYVAAELRVADALADGPVAVGELAGRCGAEPAAMVRLLRVLEALEVVRRLDDGRYVGTDVSYWLRADVPGSQRPLALMGGDDRIWRAWGGILEAMRSGGVPFERVHGKPFFEVLDEHAELGAMFQAAGGGLPEWNRAMAEALELSGRHRVVDVGGGDGGLMSALVAVHPEVEGVVYERPAVVRAANVPGEARWRFEAGDFLDSVPPGFDAYILRRILHDWDDDRAVRILANVRRAMAPDGRVFVFEYIVREETRAATAMIDFTMFVLTGGRERYLDGYRALFAEAGLGLARVSATAAGIDLLVAEPI